MTRKTRQKKTALSKAQSQPAPAPQPAQPIQPAHVEFDLLLAALPHPILVLGDDERIIYANSAAESFLRASVAMLKRLHLPQIVAFGSPLLALVAQVRRTGATVNEYSIDLGTPKLGTNKLVDVFGGPMPDHANWIILMLQQRNMAQMIERQFTHRAAAKSVSGMAAVLAHEIKNPLSGIKGAAQLLETNVSDEDRTLTQLICAESDRIANLVDGMEVFGDERPLAMGPINIHDVLNHVKELASHGVARNVEIIEDYDPSLPPVAGNRDQLIQALLNLVKNAAEAITQSNGHGDAHGHSNGGADLSEPGAAKDSRTDPGGQIRLNTAFRPGVRLAVPGTNERISLPLMIEIVDNGPGIPDAMKPHLFDPFVTSKNQGKGLGLALVAKIIGDHGGIIECASKSNQTIFRILLPMQSPPANRKQQP